MPALKLEKAGLRSIGCAFLKFILSFLKVTNGVVAFFDFIRYERVEK